MDISKNNLSGFAKSSFPFNHHAIVGNNSVVGLKLIGAVIGCLAGAWLANLPLFAWNTIWVYEDLSVYHQWVQDFYQCILDGCLTPRWDHQSFQGLGSPSFLYTSPLFFYLTSVVMAVVPDPWWAIKAGVFIAYFSTGMVVYNVCRRYMHFFPAILVAWAVQCSPYGFHLLSFQVFIRYFFAVAPAIAFVDYSLRCIPTQKGISLGVVGAAALLILAHQLAAFVMFISVPFALWMLHGKDGWRAVLAVALRWGIAVVLGIGLSAYYIVPATATLGLMAELATDLVYFNWRNSFILPFFTSRMYGTWWSGFQWVIGGWALIMAALASLALCWEPRPWTTAVRVRAALLALSWVALLLASEVSYFIWDAVLLLRWVTWPHRFLLVASWAATVAAVWPSGPGVAVRWARILPMLVFAGNLLLAAAYQVRLMQVGSRPDFVHMEAQNYYIPRTIGPEWKTYVEGGGFAAECLRKRVDAYPLQQEIHERRWRLEVPQPLTLKLPVLAFPAWEIRVGDQHVPAVVDAQDGILGVSLDAGVQEVSVAWRLLPEERWGRSMSGLACALFIVLVALRYRSPKRLPGVPRIRT